ncbi:MAG: phage baseplate assembly protein V [Gemmatimonadota bacterium]
MSVLRPSSVPVALPALVAAASLVLPACDDPTEPAPLGGSAVLDRGVLTVRGDSAGSEITIRYSGTGVDVERDGDAARFTDPVAAIEVTGGAGSDVVRYEQTVVADLDLTIACGEGDDDVAAFFAPSGSGTAMRLVADLRTGPGSDRLELRWDGDGAPALDPWITVTGETRGALPGLPEVDDEVMVAFEHGDPDRPVVVGMVWNAGGTGDAAGAAGSSRLALELDFRDGHADTDIDVTGDYRRDSLEVNADYTGVTLQQGRVAVDADTNEGDNHAGAHIITSAAHTFVDVSVAAGDGSNVVDIEDVLGGDGERTYAVDLGDGDNRTSIRFGDGERGRRLPTGTRNVNATYRSGSGTNDVVVSSEVVEPLLSVVTIDYGTGVGDTQGRYRAKMPWNVGGETDGEPRPDWGARLAVASPGGSDLDLRFDIGDPDTDDPGSFGVVSATGSQVNQSDLEFLHQRAQNANGSLEQAWELRSASLTVADSGALTVDVPPGLERLVYLQDSTAIADGAHVQVTLAGDSAVAMLAHLVGIAGAGRYDLGATAGPASPIHAVLTRDLAPTGGGFAFNVSGAAGDDVLGLDRPAAASTSNAPITHALAGGAGSDACYAPQDVAVTGCEQIDGVGEVLIRHIEGTFGTALADVWRQ